MTRAPDDSLRLNGATVLFLVAADTQTWKDLLLLAAKYIIDSDRDLRISDLIKLEQKSYKYKGCREEPKSRRALEPPIIKATHFTLMGICGLWVDEGSQTFPGKRR